jgi:hypothetical protein
MLVGVAFDIARAWHRRCRMRNILTDRIFSSGLDGPDARILMCTSECEIARIKVLPLKVITRLAPD